jgi:predicted nucleic acid-binding protein
MKLVVDVNVLFAAAVKTGATSDIIFSDVGLFAPEFIFEEFGKYEKLLLEKSHRTAEEFHMFISILSEKIQTCTADEFSEFIGNAKSVCPDPNDVPYFALALKLSCPIWSNDKLLKKQSAVKILSTAELLELLK